MGFCLVKPLADKFKLALKDGTIDPVKLEKMENGDRAALFERILDPKKFENMSPREMEKYMKENERTPNAKKINALFEEKMLTQNTEIALTNWLKNTARIEDGAKPDMLKKVKNLDHAQLAIMADGERAKMFGDIFGEENGERVNRLYKNKERYAAEQEGARKWAKQLTGITPQLRNDLTSRIERMDNILDAKSPEAFYADLAERKLGTKVTFEEAKKITEISKNLRESKTEWDPKTETWSSKEAAAQYGASRVVINNYLAELKDPYHGLTATQHVGKALGDAGKDIAKNPITGTARTIGKTISSLASNSIQMVASLDSSAFLRQGLRVLETHPKVWLKAVVGSFKDMASSLNGKEPLDEVLATAYSSPNGMNGYYEKAGILDMKEETHTGGFSEKIPILGRLYKATDIGFKSALLRMRTGVFDELVKNTKKVDFSDEKQLKSFGKIVNSLVARGDFMHTGAEKKIGDSMKAVMWAPKMLKATFDHMTAHTLDYARGEITSQAYKEAIYNRMRTGIVTTILLVGAKALDPKSVTLNPTQTGFGQIRFGKDHEFGFDITGGQAGLEQFIMREILNERRTADGKVVPFGPGFGQSNRFSTLIDYVADKVTPPLRVAIDAMKGKTFNGDKPTLMNELYQSFVAISIQNIVDLIRDPSLARGVTTVLDAFGGQGTTPRKSAKPKLK